MTGTVLAQLALTVLVYNRTGSPLLAALVFAISFLPYLIAGTLFSALVDRQPPRRLLVGCSVLSGIVALLMATPGFSVAMLLLLSFLLGLIQPVAIGARAAILPDVLTEAAYVPGRSLLRLVAQVSQVAGWAVSGVLLIVLAPQVLLIANAVSFVIAATLLRFGLRERPAKAGAGARTSLLRDSLGGLGAVLSVAPLRRVLLVGWAIPAFAVAPEALAVPYSASLSAGTVGGGALLTAIPLGTVIGEVMTNWLLRPAQQTMIVAAAAATTFVPLVAFALRPGIPLAVVILFVSGLGSSCYIGLDRMLLTAAPEPLLSRALGVQSAGTMLWQGVGFAVAGAVAEVAAPMLVVPVAAGCGLVAVTLFVVARRRTAPTLVVTAAASQEPGPPAR